MGYDGQAQVKSATENDSVRVPRVVFASSKLMKCFFESHLQRPSAISSRTVRKRGRRYNVWRSIEEPHRCNAEIQVSINVNVHIFEMVTACY